MMIIYCPKCHEPIGDTSFASGFKENFYKVNKHGRPVCDLCGHNKDHPRLRFALEALALTAVLIGVSIFFIYYSKP